MARTKHGERRHLRLPDEDGVFQRAAEAGRPTVHSASYAVTTHTAKVSESLTEKAGG